MSLLARIFGLRASDQIESRVIPLLQMMLADGEVNPKELAALQVHLSHIGVSDSQFQRMLERARTSPKEPSFPTDPHQRVELMLGACAMMVIDGDVAVTELAYLHMMAARMEIPPAVLHHMIQEAIKLGQKANPGVNLQADFEAALIALAASVANR